MSHQYSLKGDCYHCANYTNCYSGQSKICIIYFFIWYFKQIFYYQLTTNLDYYGNRDCNNQMKSETVVENTSYLPYFFFLSHCKGNKPLGGSRHCVGNKGK